MKVKFLVLAVLGMFAFGCQPKEQPKEEPKQAQGEVDKAKAEAEKVKAEAEKLKAEAEKAKAEAEAAKAKAEAEAAKAAQPKPEEVKKEEVAAPAEVVGEPNPTGKKVELVFHVMSQCPFGTQVMNGISPVLRKMGAWIDFRLEFIGNVDGDNLTSMHGDAEVKGDIVELCLQKHLYENYKYFDVLDCMNKDARAIPGNWEQCAKDAKIADDKFALVKACYEGQEGKDLTKASFQKSEQVGARGSPTMFLGGKPYRGGRGENDYMRGLCQEMAQDAKAKACADIPPPVEFEAIVLGDKRCTDRTCDTSRLVMSFQSMFPGMKLKTLDWEQEEAKKLFDEEGITFLPVILFGPEIAKADGYDRLGRFLTDSKSAKYKVFAGRASHDPKSEICDNKVDDTGDGVIDCDDATCKQKMVCREEVAGKLELFVMSQCPFGVKGLNAMEQVLATFGADLKFEVHYIGDIQDGKPTSMHGQGEVDENIRELCAIKKFPEAYMKYILCRNKDIRSENWQACATAETGVDAKVIEECFKGEGTQLLIDDYAVAKGLGIGASPTWIANGRYQFSGIDSKTIGQNICQHNSALAGCAKLDTLAGDTGAPAGSCN